MKIAVALLTCDRPAYTARTIDSFLAHNPDRSQFALIHGDDASRDPSIAGMVEAAGFETVVRHSVRCGHLAMRHAMVGAAAHYADWVLLLENDMESVRPFPWALFNYVSGLRKFYCLRLFGQFKGPHGVEPCKTTHQWKDNRKVIWRRLSGTPEPAEMADIHWSSQPSVTRASSLQAFHRKGVRDLGLTARVVSNVMIHIGVERTRELRAAC